jgi:hypothetical protein
VDLIPSTLSTALFSSTFRIRSVIHAEQWI